MSLTTKRILLALLVAAFACGSVAMPATAKKGKTSKCKKAKKGKKGKKKKGCPGGSSGSGGGGLPGQQAHPTATPGAGSGGGGGGTTGGGGATQLAPTAVNFAENPVLGGTSTQGEVVISGAAPAGGQAVSLSTSAPARVDLPSSVVVAPGQTEASFPIDTTSGPDTTESITASVGSAVASSGLNIVQFPTLTTVNGVNLSHQCYPDTGLTNFGVNTVTLNVVTPANLPISLSSDSPSLTFASGTTTGSVTIPGGSKTGVFTVNTSSPPTSAATVTASVNGSSAQDTASVRDSSSPAPSPAALSVNPNFVAAPASPVGTVTLDCEALAGGMTVSLSSDNPGVTVPPTATVSQDSLSATFPVTVAAGTPDGTAHITATTPSGSRQVTLTIDSTLGT